MRVFLILTLRWRNSIPYSQLMMLYMMWCHAGSSPIRLRSSFESWGSLWAWETASSSVEWVTTYIPAGSFPFCSFSSSYAANVAAETLGIYSCTGHNVSGNIVLHHKDNRWTSRANSLKLHHLISFRKDWLGCWLRVLEKLMSKYRSGYNHKSDLIVFMWVTSCGHTSVMCTVTCFIAAAQTQMNHCCQFLLFLSEPLPCADVVAVVSLTDMVSQALELSNQPHVVVATPGRLADHIRSSDTFSMSKIQFLVSSGTETWTRLGPGQRLVSAVALINLRSVWLC